MLDACLEAEGGDEEINHPTSNDLMFDPWLTLSPGSMPLAATLIGPVVQALAKPGRQPRSELMLGVQTVVPTLVANLILLHQTRPAGSRLVVSMEHAAKTRYDRAGLRKLPDVVKVLEMTGYIRRYEAEYKKRRTTIEPCGDFKQRLSHPSFSVADTVRAEGEELIHLSARQLVGRVKGKKKPKLRINYEDTSETVRLRAEMEELNGFLSQHTITLEGQDVPPFRLIRKFALRRPDDPVSFNLHGRLYGGFWMTLKASERHRLRINGEPVADLDFASMFPRLAYAHLGVEVPEGDLYAIPGLEGHRDGAKAAFSALLSYPKEMKVLPARVQQQLPPGWNTKRVRQAFAEHHYELSVLFERDIGLDLMFTESRILLMALQMLMRQGIPALPMHDGMMVPGRYSQAATEILQQASKDVAEQRLPVIVKFMPVADNTLATPKEVLS